MQRFLELGQLELQTFKYEMGKFYLITVSMSNVTCKIQNYFATERSYEIKSLMYQFSTIT